MLGKTIKQRFPGVLVEYAALPPHEQEDFVTTTRTGSIGVSFNGHRRAVRELRTGPLIEADISEGSAFVTPGSDIVWLRVAEPTEALEIYPDPGLIAAVADELGASRPLMLDEVAGRPDVAIWSAAFLFRAALLGGRPMSDIEVATRLRMLVGHALHRYSAVGHGPRLVGRLDDGRLVRVLDFIEAHLGDPLTLEALAQVAALSPFHFLRSFRRTTGMTPHDYVAARRMDRARRLLGDTKLSVAEVRATVGYSHPAHFSRAFARAVGLLPQQFRSMMRS